MMRSGNTLEPEKSAIKEILIMETHQMRSSIKQKPTLILTLIRMDVLELLPMVRRNLQDHQLFSQV